ncbi:MAG: hypothetical protein E7L44_08545, partial [Leuconostoc citreum]|nr:hypothetical protein [Leuconostoc citreum]
VSSHRNAVQTNNPNISSKIDLNRDSVLLIPYINDRSSSEYRFFVATKSAREKDSPVMETEISVLGS